MDDEFYTSLFPHWTIPSFQSIAGRFPLGLEAVALNVLANGLAPGLPVLSRHPRYWSIYTYLIKRFQDTQKYTNKTTNATLGRYLKAREIIFGCAALLCPHHKQEPLRGVIGSDVFNAWLSKTKHDTTPLPTNAEGALGAYLQQPLGGYGQVYRGAMIDLELIFPADLNPNTKFDNVYREVGTAVAEIFAEAIKETRYVREYIDRDDMPVPRDVVEELASISCFCQLRRYESERKLLTDVLLGRAQARARSESSNEVVKKRAQRTETVRMFLDLALETKDTPLNEASFRDLLYSGYRTGGTVWYPRQEVQNIWRQWWLIQLREVVVNTLNSLLKDFVRWGNRCDGAYYPLNVDSYIDKVSKLSLPALPDLPEAIKLTDVSIGQLAHALDSKIVHFIWPFSRENEVQANNILSERSFQPFTPPNALLTLLLVQRKMAAICHKDTFTREEIILLEEGNKDRLSTFYLYQWLEKRIDRDEPALQTFASLIREMVVDQHLCVAMDKLPINTFRFYEEGAGLRFHPDENVETSPISVRFEAISEALFGLDLIRANLSKSSHEPTGYGWEILNG